MCSKMRGGCTEKKLSAVILRLRPIEPIKVVKASNTTIPPLHAEACWGSDNGQCSRFNKNLVLLFLSTLTYGSKVGVVFT